MVRINTMVLIHLAHKKLVIIIQVAADYAFH